MIDSMHILLSEWALYYAQGGGVDIGYKHSTIEYRLMREGPDAAAGTAPAVDPDAPEYVEKVERAILQMEPWMQLLVKITYTYSCTRDEQAKVYSRQVGQKVNRKALIDLIDRSHYWLQGHLESEKKVVKGVALSGQ